MRNSWILMALAGAACGSAGAFEGPAPAVPATPVAPAAIEAPEALPPGVPLERNVVPPEVPEAPPAPAKPDLPPEPADADLPREPVRPAAEAGTRSD